MAKPELHTIRSLVSFYRLNLSKPRSDCHKNVKRAGLFADDTQNLFSDAYLRLRERFLKTSQESYAASTEIAGDNGNDVSRDAPALTEKTLRTVWYDGRFERRGLATIDGKRLSVVKPGEWNLGSGPDFHGAEIRIEDQTIRGDVELHLLSQDWKRHGHDRDAAYNNVVLHVCLAPPRTAFRALTSDGKSIPSVCLAGRLPEPLAALVRNFDAEGYPFNSHCGIGSCGKKMNLAKFDLLARLIRLSADGRVLLKAARTASTDSDDYLGAFYPRLLECLGYHPNKAAMARLAERLPWSSLKTLLAKTPAAERIERLEAMLFGAAGLLPQPTPEWDEETNEKLSRLNSIWMKHKGCLETQEAQLPWVFRQLRPANFPQRRLAGLAVLLSRVVDDLAAPGVAPFLRLGGVDETVPEKKSRSGMSFIVETEGYFARRCRWGGKLFSRSAALIGPDRAQAIWINAFLPSALQVCRRTENETLERRLHEHFCGISLREPNGPARLMAHRLFGSERARRFPLKQERQQQGLLQIFQDFCDIKQSACSQCSFPQVLDLSFPEIYRG